MRSRDFNRLGCEPYDVLVIGGGIMGLACAYEGATRGLRVALIDAGDYGAGTSFNHQKTAHGGLRALQSLSVVRAREAIRERRALARIAPWLLRPLPFIIGTYRSVTRSRLALRGAFYADRWIARDRNEGLEPELHLPPARLLSRTATRKLFPGITPQGLTGGAQWYDYQMVENDRLTFAFAAAADRAGADLCSYAEAQSVSLHRGRMVGVTARDGLTGGLFEVRARTIVNAAGAHAGRIMTMMGVKRPFPLVKAMNLVTTRPAADLALAAPDAGGRMLTLVPWRARAIVGTWQSAVTAAPGEGVTAAEVEGFIARANAAFPALRLGAADVALVHRGVVPAVVRSNGSVDLLPSSQILDHARDGVEGAVSVVGAKYTTARAVAERVITIIGRKSGRRLAKSRTAQTILPCAGIADHEALALEQVRALNVPVAPPVLRHLVARYAEGAARVVRILADRPQLARAVGSGAPAIGAEVVYAIRDEAAVRLSDIVLRRTTLGAAGHPGADALANCAALAAEELGWGPEQMRQEIAEVERTYRVGAPEHPAA